MCAARRPSASPASARARDASDLAVHLDAGLLRQVLPDEVEVADTLDDLDGALYEAEAEAVRGAVDKRRREFTTVRVCARTALERLGVPPGPVVPGVDGAPVWPSGVVGSLTHCSGYRGAAVARTEHVAAVGVDAEPDAPLHPGVLREIALPPELRWARGELPPHLDVAPDRLLFSAKEAIYKAWYPLTGRWLGFTDVLVTVAEWPPGVFTGRLLVPGHRQRGRTLGRLDGRWLGADGLLVTAVTVPPEAVPVADAPVDLAARRPRTPRHRSVPARPSRPQELTVITPRLSPTPGQRQPRPRRYLMCPPTHFGVTYAINPWMDPARPVDRDLALRQWETLRQTYLDLGHEVEVIPPEPGLPDMVFAANGGLVIGGRALGARFAHPERQPEGPAYLRWLAGSDLEDLGSATHVNEGEGDFLVVGDLVLAGTGFRTDPQAHAEVQELFGLPVVGLRLVDPCYYHLDTALAVLDDTDVAYYPGAFSPGSRRVLERLFPDALTVSASDAAVLGLNAVSDGRHVVLPRQATGLAEALRARGYEPVGVDVSELLKAGGGVKCSTLELRPAPVSAPRISAGSASSFLPYPRRGGRAATAA